MKKFNACYLNVRSLKGIGNYLIQGDDFYVETDDSHIVKEFKFYQRTKNSINSLGFTLSETDKRILHNGPFEVKSIDKKMASGQTIIELLRSNWV